MKVLLRESITKLGTRGDVVSVAAGYGRNYLLPKGLAVEPTPDNLKRIDVEKKKYQVKMLEEKAQFEELAQTLGAASCTIQAKADENGHLYGSVTEAMIVEAFVTDGIVFDAKAIEMEEHFKELGVFEVQVRLHPDVIATTKVWVVEEN